MELSKYKEAEIVRQKINAVEDVKKLVAKFLNNDDKYFAISRLRTFDCESLKKIEEYAVLVLNSQIEKLEENFREI